MDTDPKVSTVDKFLTKTFFEAIRLAVNDKQHVTQTGRPDGRNPTMEPMSVEIIPETDKNPGYETRSQKAHKSTMRRATKKAPIKMKMMNRLMSCMAG